MVAASRSTDPPHVKGPEGKLDTLRAHPRRDPRRGSKLRLIVITSGEIYL